MPHDDEVSLEYPLDEWMTQIGCDFSNSEWVGDGSEELRALNKFPKYLTTSQAREMLRRLLSRNSKERINVDVLNTRIDELESGQLEDDDRYGVEDLLAALCFSWRSVLDNLEHSQEDACRKEAMNLLAWAFHLRLNANHFFRVQAPLCVSRDCVVADAIMTKALPQFWVEYIHELRWPYVFSWTSKQSMLKLSLSVISMVFEAKGGDWETALRRLVLSFSCAQKQRRALRMTDGPVFGATMNGGRVVFFVSYWKGDELVVDTVFHAFHLRYLAHFVGCYVALCAIAEYQTRWLENEFARWDVNKDAQQQALEDSTKKPWRAEPVDEDVEKSSGAKRIREDGDAQGKGKKRATSWDTGNLALSSCTYSLDEVDAVACENRADFVLDTDYDNDYDVGN